MLKKIDASELKVGMFIHDLDCGWMEHPFVRNRFAIASDAEIARIREAGIRGIVIDCAKGQDVDHAQTLEQAQAATEAEIATLALKPAVTARIPVDDELARARGVRQQAVNMVRMVMTDVRLGRAIELDQVAPVVTSVTDSILRNRGALLGLLRIKNADDYTFLHSVSVCALLVAFCRSLDMDEETIYQAGMGGLLHDVGKALVPEAVLNKQGRLSDEEFAIIKRHPVDGHDILLRTAGIGPIPLNITRHHHERYDGSGYPDRQAGEAIGSLAQMAAIVDVYDAITSDRCYHKGISAAEALRKIFEWSKFHFNPTLTQQFIRCVGIYPVGTLVLLESGRLGVVTEQNEASLLTPQVKVFFNTKTKTYVRPETLDLSRSLGHGGGDRIVRHEVPEQWQVDPSRFLGGA